MPVKDAGCLIEPPVSVPIVAGVNLAASAEADPPEDPPGTTFLPTGLLTFPKKLVSSEMSKVQLVKKLCQVGHQADQLQLLQLN